MSQNYTSESFQVFKTKDGSNSIQNIVLGDTYHSVHGAFQESQHVFIENGLKIGFYNNKKSLNILELGFGSGLNALLTLNNCDSQMHAVRYVTLEKFPIPKELANKLDYHLLPGLNNYLEDFQVLHECEWNKFVLISKFFEFKKVLIDFNEYTPDSTFDIIYHDAFAPQTHEEAWNEEFLRKCHSWLNQGGFLITYCAKGDFKRTLKACGFEVETLKGPIGKREITRAFRQPL